MDPLPLATQSGATVIAAALPILAGRVFAEIRRRRLRTTFMRPVLVFAFLIFGARVAEFLYLAADIEIAYFAVGEWVILMVAYAVLIYGLFDYLAMLRALKVPQDLHGHPPG